MTTNSLVYDSTFFKKKIFKYLDKILKIESVKKIGGFSYE